MPLVGYERRESIDSLSRQVGSNRHEGALSGKEAAVDTAYVQVPRPAIRVQGVGVPGLDGGV